MKRTAVLTTALAFACAVLAIPSAAQAQAPTTPSIVDSLAPADGASIAPGSNPTFQLTSNDAYGPLMVQVSRAPTLTEDGVLANDSTVEFVSLRRSDAIGTTYAGTSGAAHPLWSSTPGVYYWQAFSTVYRQAPDTGSSRMPVGPVRRIVVTEVPGLKLTVNEGTRVVRNVLKKAFGSRYTKAKNVKLSHTRRSAAAVDYRVSLRKDGVRYALTIKVRETVAGFTYTVSSARR